MIKLLFSFLLVCISVARADFGEGDIAQPANQNLVRLYDVNRATGTHGMPSFFVRMSENRGSSIPRGGYSGVGHAGGNNLSSNLTSSRAVTNSGFPRSQMKDSSFVKKVDKRQSHAERMTRVNEDNSNVVTNQFKEHTKKIWGVEGADKIIKHTKYGKFYRDPNTRLWWSKDLDHHGGSIWPIGHIGVIFFSWVLYA